MENKVNLYGASGHCKVIIDILQCSNVTVMSVIDDNPNAKSVLDKMIINSSKIDVNSVDNIILSIGNNKVRKRISEQLTTSFAKAIHPSAVISNYSEINEGTVVMANAVINSDSKIGKHCIINSGAIVEHDCIIQNFAHISPNASLAGGVFVGEGSQIGIGASVIQGVKIGKWVVIGAGAVILNDVPDYAVVVGNPGKIIKYSEINE